MPYPPSGGLGKSGHPVGLEAEAIEVLALAAAYSLPRSILLGRPWPEPGEPLWTEDDLEAAIAFERWRLERCSTCGTFPEEWVDEKGRRHPVDRYEPELYQCPGCAVLEDFERQVRPKKGGPASGTRVRLRRIGEAVWPGVFGAASRPVEPADEERPPGSWLAFRRFRGSRPPR